MFLVARCGGCAAAGWAVCPACAAELRPATPPAIEGTDGTAAVLRYEGPGRALVGALKFGRNRSAVTWWGERLAAICPGRPDVVTWAPTSPSRRQARGFDQAELLARAAARSLRCPARPLLWRGEGPAQTGRSAADRQRGPAFTTWGPVPSRVLLIDDVVTTGATLRAAALALRKGGAGTVWALGAAWTP